jgi:hypothetical protein
MNDSDTWERACSTSLVSFIVFFSIPQLLWTRSSMDWRWTIRGWFSSCILIESVLLCLFLNGESLHQNSRCLTCEVLKGETC